MPWRAGGRQPPCQGLRWVGVLHAEDGVGQSPWHVCAPSLAHHLDLIGELFISCKLHRLYMLV